MTLTVSYQKIGKNSQKLIMDSQVTNDIIIDATDIPVEAQAGTSARLLGAACLNCFAETFADAMEARNAAIDSLQGKAVILKDRDDSGRTKINSIEISLKVEIEDSYLPQFEKCKRIMNRGCLITHSMAASIKFSYDIQRIENR